MHAQWKALHMVVMKVLSYPCWAMTDAWCSIMEDCWMLGIADIMSGESDTFAEKQNNIWFMACTFGK